MNPELRHLLARYETYHLDNDHNCDLLEILQAMVQRINALETIVQELQDYVTKPEQD